MGNTNTYTNTNTFTNSKTLLKPTINNIFWRIDLDSYVFDIHKSLSEQQAGFELVISNGVGNVDGLICKFLVCNYKRQILDSLKEVLSRLFVDADFLQILNECPTSYQSQVASIIYVADKFKYPELVQLRCFFRKQFKNLSSFEGNGIF